MADLMGKQPHIVPVTWRDPRAVALRKLMDVEMSAIYGSLFSSSEPDKVLAARRKALVIDPTLLKTNAPSSPQNSDLTAN